MGPAPHRDAAFVGYLSLRARASYNILRAAYPQEASSS
jgi:hypothetical protein